MTGIPGYAGYVPCRASCAFSGHRETYIPKLFSCLLFTHFHLLTFSNPLYNGLVSLLGGSLSPSLAPAVAAAGLALKEKKHVRRCSKTNKSSRESRAVSELHHTAERSEAQRRFRASTPRTSWGRPTSERTSCRLLRVMPGRSLFTKVFRGSAAMFYRFIAVCVQIRMRKRVRSSFA